MDRKHTWIRETGRKRRLRILAGLLGACVLLTTYPDILPALSVVEAEEPGRTDVRYITGFTELSEEIREQTVPVGGGGADASRYTGGVCRSRALIGGHRGEKAGR